MNIIKKAFKEWHKDVKCQELIELSWNCLLDIPIIVYVATIVIILAIL